MQWWLWGDKTLNIHLGLERSEEHAEIMKIERNPILNLASPVKKRIMYWNSWNLCIGFISHLNNTEQIAQILGIIFLRNKHWSHFVKCHKMASLILFYNKSQADGTLKHTMQFKKQNHSDIFVWLAKIMCWSPKWKVLGIHG